MEQAPGKQAPGKRAAAAITAPTLDLARMWQGDLAEPLAAFLQLNSIGAVGKLSRRCRDRLPAVLINLARKHGALRGSMTGFVKAIQDTGRDDWWFSGEALDSWRRQEPNETEGSFTAEEVTIDGSRCIKITTSHPRLDGPSLPGHNTHGGLKKEFAAAEKLCVRQVKYRFCFTDLDPTESHSDPYEHGFAFFTFGPYEKALQLQKGLLVEPSQHDPTAYQLVWWDQALGHDGPTIMHVRQGTWYDVTMDFDWRIPGEELVAYISVTGEDGSSCPRKTIKTIREPLTSCWIYNFSASVSHYSSISVRYSKHTPRDGVLDEEE